MGIKGIAVVTALVLAVAAGGISCGSGPDREEIANAVAEEWVQDSIKVVSDVVVELLILSPALRDTLGRMQESQALLAGLVADQVRDKIAWSYSAPTRDRQALYRVTATAAMELEIDLPIIGEWPYAVTLPIHLLIDTDAEKVQEWTADFDNAAVASY